MTAAGIPFLIPGEPYKLAVRFPGAVTGTPVWALWSDEAESFTAPDTVVDSGSNVWVFTIAVPANAPVGKSARVAVSGVVGGTTHYFDFHSIYAETIGSGDLVAGSGARQIQIVATDDAVGVQGVFVSIVGTALSVSTGTLGTAAINVEPDTYTLRFVVPVNYEPVADREVVVGESLDVEEAVVLVSRTVTLADAPLTNVSLPIEDQYGERLPNVTVKFAFVRHVTGAVVTGVVINTPPPRKSDADGICTVRLRRLATYTASYSIPGVGPKVVTFATGDTGSDLVVG
jgi:hypothetical protein